MQLLFFCRWIIQVLLNHCRSVIVCKDFVMSLNSIFTPVYEHVFRWNHIHFFKVHMSWINILYVRFDTQRGHQVVNICIKRHNCRLIIFIHINHRKKTAQSLSFLRRKILLILFLLYSKCRETGFHKLYMKIEWSLSSYLDLFQGKALLIGNKRKAILEHRHDNLVPVFSIIRLFFHFNFFFFFGP